MTNSADPDQQKPTDLDLHCLQRQSISGFRRTRVNLHFAWWVKISADICLFVLVLRPSKPNGVMLSVVSLPNHTFIGQA